MAESENLSQREELAISSRWQARRAFTPLLFLSFANASGDPETEYLSDGITESLINRLAQIPSLRVVPRSVAFRYKGPDIDLHHGVARRSRRRTSATPDRARGDGTAMIERGGRGAAEPIAARRRQHGVMIRDESTEMVRLRSRISNPYRPGGRFASGLTPCS